MAAISELRYTVRPEWAALQTSPVSTRPSLRIEASWSSICASGPYRSNWPVVLSRIQRAARRPPRASGEVGRRLMRYSSSRARALGWLRLTPAVRVRLRSDQSPRHCPPGLCHLAWQYRALLPGRLGSAARSSTSASGSPLFPFCGRALRRTCGHGRGALPLTASSGAQHVQAGHVASRQLCEDVLGRSLGMAGYNFLYEIKSEACTCWAIDRRFAPR